MLVLSPPCSSDRFAISTTASGGANAGVTVTALASISLGLSNPETRVLCSNSARELLSERLTALVRDWTCSASHEKGIASHHDGYRERSGGTVVF